MSTQQVNNTEPCALSRSQRRSLAFVGMGAVVVLVLIAVVAALMKYGGGDRLVIPDEKLIAAERLAGELAGPLYFQVASGQALDDAGISSSATQAPHISAAAASAQVERIANERHFTETTKAKLQELIEQLTEAPKSRAVGEDHINLLRLNLALDELK